MDAPTPEEAAQVKAQGVYVGYNGYRPEHKPLPSPPYGLKDPFRYIWIDGWLLGRRLAAQHWAMMEAEIQNLVIDKS